MVSKKVDYPGKDDSSPSEQISSAQIARIKEILLLLANAVQAAKIFPPDHPTVMTFVSDLYARLKDYLDRHWKLELGIEEQAFTCGGKSVYEDPHPVKSLPFFFFKDGMQTLYFYRGLEMEEVKGFLETIRQVSQLPPEEGDIVSALWERDFANIRYLAPEDFLETRVGAGKPPLEIRVDREEFWRGRIDLAPEDLEEMRASPVAGERQPMVSGEDSWPGGAKDFNLFFAPADEKDLEEVEALLGSSRMVSSEEEYQSLVIELLCLEERKDQLPVLGDVIKEVHHKALQKKDFQRASRLLASLHELKESSLEKDPGKAAFIEMTIGELSQDNLLIKLEDSLDFSRIADMGAFLEYLRLIGPRAGRLAAAVFEGSSDSGLRQKTLEILESIGTKEPDVLMTLAQDSKPSLTQEIIRLIVELQGKKATPSLASFVRSQNRDIKLEAIKALGQTGDEAAGKILQGFLTDEDEDVRIAALESLGRVPEFPPAPLLAMVKDRTFQKKSLKEIRAALATLARSGTEEACAGIQKHLKLRPWWPSQKRVDIALLAVEALSAMVRPSAQEALREGAKSRVKKIKQACLERLSLASAEPSISASKGKG